MSEDGFDFAMRLGRGVGLLSFLLVFPVALLTLLLGVLYGLIAFGACIPLSAHLSGLHRLGEDWEQAQQQVRGEAQLHLVTSGLAVFFGMNAMALVPSSFAFFPLALIIVPSFFALSLYVIGVRGGSVNRLPSRVGVPLVALAVALLALK